MLSLVTNIYLVQLQQFNDEVTKDTEKFYSTVMDMLVTSIKYLAVSLCY